MPELVLHPHQWHVTPCGEASCVGFAIRDKDGTEIAEVITQDPGDTERIARLLALLPDLAYVCGLVRRYHEEERWTSGLQYGLARDADEAVQALVLALGGAAVRSEAVG